jgi:hypothetical protein
VTLSLSSRCDINLVLCSEEETLFHNSPPPPARLIATEHRREDRRFLVSASYVTFSNLDSLFSCETCRVNLGIRSWKEHLPEWAGCSKTIGGIYFTNKWRAETLQRGSEFYNFKPRRKSGIFNCISLLNCSIVWSVIIEIFWKKESIPIEWRICCLLTRHVFTCTRAVRHHIYSLWSELAPMGIPWAYRCCVTFSCVFFFFQV